MKKIMYFAVSLIVVLGVTLGIYEKTSADADDSNFTNLIIFMRFADEDEFIDDVYEGTSVRKITDNSYNTAEYNVSDYYRSVSENKLRMKSVYLLDNGGSIRLSHPRGYYAEYSEDNKIGYKDAGEAASRMYDLKLEWSKAVNDAIANGNVISGYDGTVKYGYDELDKDGDGFIDALTIIYKNTTQSNISVGWSSPLWNYQDYADHVTINTDKGSIKSGKYVQLTNTYTKPDGDSNGYLYRDSFGNVTVSIATAIHEMGHIMGLKDLYNSSNVSPVYYMSVMAKHISPVPQFPSVKEIEVLGWVNQGGIETITSAGQYSITALGTSEYGVIGYKLEIPEKGKTLYLEYRNFGENGNKYDSQNKELYKTNGNQVDRVPMKSGLVCYLIDSDTRFPNNMNYYSPKWNYEVLGGTYQTKTDAAVAAGEEIWITNDIGIMVTEIDGNTLTFTIEGDFKEHIHSGGEATCVKRAVCSVCNQEYGDFDPNKHEHTVVRGASSSTCTDFGYTGDTYCADCDKMLSKGTDIEKISHELQHVEATAATAAKEGNIEYYYCKVCGNSFLDGAASQPVDKKDTITAKLAPTVIEGNNVVIDVTEEKSAVFRSDAAFSDFVRVELDNVELVKDKEFTVKEGSIIVTLMPDVVGKLSVGGHKINIVSSGGMAVANFTISKSQEPSSSETETTSEAEPGSSETETTSEAEPGSSETETTSEAEPGSGETETTSKAEPGSGETETTSEAEPSSSEIETSSEVESGSSEIETTSEAEPSSSDIETTGEAESTGSETEPTSDAETTSQVDIGNGETDATSDVKSTSESESGSVDKPENNLIHLSPSTGAAVQVKAWVIVGALLVSAFAFITKRK